MATVLVVDDSPVDQKLIGGLLEKAQNIDVIYAANGEEAMLKVHESAPDLVLTDLIMPGMSGLELVAEVVNSTSLIPVILMTGKGSEEIAVEALKAGASSYVPKGKLAHLLVETVENVLSVSMEERTQLRLMDCMTRNECSFRLDNDDAIIPPLISYLHRCVRSVGLCDETNGVRVCVALEEALRNALHHGNLELDSSLREDNGVLYNNLFDERRQSEPFSKRRIFVDVDIDHDQGRFVIRDEGPGFNPNDLPDPTDPANLEKATGRGLLLMRTFMDEVAFNDTGNEVTMIKRCPQ